MGLIIVPVVAFWLAALFFTCRAGFYWMMGKPVFPDAALLMLAAFTAALCYVLLGLLKFRARNEVWAFEIPCFFLFNKYASALFACVVVAHFFGGAIFEGDLARAVILVVAFAVSCGNLLGCFGAGAFMKKYNISQTY